MIKTVVLEPAAAEFVAASANPYLNPGPVRCHTTLQHGQSDPVDFPAVDEEWTSVEGGPTGRIAVRVVRPAGATEDLPVVLYIHGGGFLVGNAETHDRLVRQLAVGAHAAVVFPIYDLSPRNRYPVAIEQNYAVAQWIAAEGSRNRLDGSRIAVAGDSFGGNLSAALTLMAKQRGDLELSAQVLFYPMTDADLDTPSSRQFAKGYFLRRESMRCFWDQYAADPAERAQVTACPLRATTEQLAGLPPALIITAEADIMRDQGEAYAEKLRAAGVPVVSVRYDGIIHDFLMLNALRETRAAAAAIEKAVAALREAFA